MPKLSVRRWMLVGLLIFAFTGAPVYFLVSLADGTFRQPPLVSRQTQDQVLAEIERGATEPGWADPAWQASLTQTLSQDRLSVLLTDAAGRRILAAGAIAGPRSDLSTVDIFESGGRVGRVELVGPHRHDWVAPLGALLAFGVAVFFVRWQMGRYLVRPLEAMAAAANKVARGDLEFVLPPTTVTEVDEVRAALETMAAGLRASLAKQAQLEEQRRFYIGAIAHDLRTPLFALRGYLTGLEEGVAGSPQKIAAYAAVCRQKADQLEALVQDLFAYTRADLLQQTLRREPVDLGRLMRRTVEGMRARADQTNTRFCLDGSPDECVVTADERLLERAIENLLDNALRYAGPSGRIDVGWCADNSLVTLTVADSGPGIREADLDHIFEPFYRGEDSRNRDTGGTGLGLSIAKRVLLAHDGDLTVKNRPSGGAVFTGRLPASRPLETPVAAGHAE